MAKPGSTLLIEAPPGAGKTTRVPLTLLEPLAEQGSILLLEPRRLAARAAARRLAEGLGEPVGGRVGYSVRLESRRSAATRIEALTGGILLRRLQADPALEGVACVIFDEFHERNAEADLTLALLRQARGLLRPDLRLVLMSATLDLEPLARRLDDARVIRSQGRSHPVELLQQPPRPGERLPSQVLRALEQHWLPFRRARETVLVFLPGQREIRDCTAVITATPWGREVACTPLHGGIPLEAQARAIAPCDRDGGRVVLATSIAESSLTIEGVALVIDSGLSRRSRFDPARGMDALVTVPASLASAEQRRGRAGRLGPGRCLRLWGPGEQRRRPDFDPPELLETDPLPIALQLAAWGSPLGRELPWIEPPPRAGLEQARELLRDFGALDDDGRITAHGRRLAGLGLHPRLGHMLLDAAASGELPLACSLAVLLSERDPLDRTEAGSDLLRRLDWLHGGQRHRNAERQHLLRLRRHLMDQVLAGIVRDEPAQARQLCVQRQGACLDGDPALLLARAYPERLAAARVGGGGRFLLRCGRGARLRPGDPLGQCEALVVAHLDGEGTDALVHLAVPLSTTRLRVLAEQLGQWQESARWDPQTERVRCERRLRLGALTLERRPWPEASGSRVREALLEGLGQMGLEVLPWTRHSRQLKRRLCLARDRLGPPWPDRGDATLAAEPGSWLGAQLEGVRSRRELQALDLVEALWGDLDWAHRRELDRLLPESLRIPSGRMAPIRYDDGEAVLAVKLQEMFGCLTTPALLNGQLPLTIHLLTPAGRPAAITRDLEGFWSGGYAAVRRELRGRYPRHPWPEDPRRATATTLSKAAQARRESRGAD